MAIDPQLNFSRRKAPSTCSEGGCLVYPLLMSDVFV